MMGRSPQYYIPSFVEIGLPVPKEKIFEWFLPYIWAWRPSWSCDQHHVNIFLHILVPESFHTKFGSEWHNGFFENLVLFLYVHDLGPSSRNDLDLQYSYTLMKSISCLYLPTFRSQASKASEKSILFSLFPIEKP